MARRVMLLCCALLALALAGNSCNKPTGGTTGKQPVPGKRVVQGGTPDDKVPEILPVPRLQRKYPDVDPRVRKAWFLIETAYYVVDEKYKAASEMLKSSDPETIRKGAAQKTQATEEIQKNLFGTNPEVVKLFESSIADNPENPLNIASYALYLQPRKTFRDATNYDEQYDKALQLMDQAIKLWPDEADFYCIKVAMMTGPLKVHEWSRSISLEEETIQAQLPAIRELLTKAEKYDPDNNMINYWRAQLLARLTPTSDFKKVEDEIKEQIHIGNTKPNGHFAFPPPCEPFPDEAHFVRLNAQATEGQFYDGWMNYGYYDQPGELAIYAGLLEDLHWPKDKAAVADLMYSLYNMGRTKPFDTTFFSWQQKILLVLMNDPGLSQADKSQLASANFMLTDYYTNAAQQMASVPLLTDPTKYDVIGLSEFETKTTRLGKQRELLQPLHASYLHEVAATLGLPPFPLDEDPKRWGD